MVNKYNFYLNTSVLFYHQRDFLHFIYMLKEVNLGWQRGKVLGEFFFVKLVNLVSNISL